MEAIFHYLLLISIILCLAGISTLLFIQRKRRNRRAITIETADAIISESINEPKELLLPSENKAQPEVTEQNIVFSQPQINKSTLVDKETTFQVCPSQEKVAHEKAISIANELPLAEESRLGKEVNLKALETAFYDAMFGTENRDEELNRIEKIALSNVRDILNNPDKLSKQIPPLPIILLQLIDTLKDPNATFMAIAEIIEKDPALAVEVLKEANSSLYYHGNGEITSLRNAVSLLGVSGVTSIATMILLEKIRPEKPIYYKMFGRQIWVHSVQCALLCKLLAPAEEIDEFDAYFLGLIHDIGKIIIFNCLCNALSTEFPDSTPGSLAYKELMSEMSADISFFIAQEWQLPEIYSQALQSQRQVDDSPLASLLYKANLLSEVYLLHKKEAIDEILIENLLTNLSIDNEIWTRFIDLAAEVEKETH